jgi:replication factor A1
LYLLPLWLLCRPAADDGTILAVKFNFTQLHHLPQVETGKIIDVLGIVQQEGDYNEITTKRGEQLGKRDLTIVDESNTGVKLTIWG